MREELVFSHCLRYNQAILRHRRQIEARLRSPDAEEKQAKHPREPRTAEGQTSNSSGSQTSSPEDLFSRSPGRSQTWEDLGEREVPVEQRVGVSGHEVQGNAGSLPDRKESRDARAVHAETLKTVTHADTCHPVAICSVVAGGYSDDIAHTVRRHAILFQ
ncbi:hypothetical protein TGVEG_441840 [Toxoplasma gondii VEG]|uniref:Uncharacterized protein n=1 Tax=Toxoplasma gondii (strain ATCC 50861 / VEG) TaxID=432359 RepID=V4Z7Z9_TOXGV|nr:hypothetical protein TGVEG_441840 [Toxoplasma gondii VEG]